MTTCETLTHGTCVFLSQRHRFGTDAMLLADFCRPRRAEFAADLCGGCGIVALRWHDEGHRGTCVSVELNGEAHGLLAAALALGAAYILWLAWKTYSGGGSHGSSQSDCTFLSGLLLQLVSVKVILYGITIMSTFVLPHTSSLAVYAGVSAFLAAMAFVSTSSWALFGAAFSRFLSSHERLANTVMALLLVYCAVSLYL